MIFMHDHSFYEHPPEIMRFTKEATDAPLS
jgi:hypothetical protein